MQKKDTRPWFQKGLTVFAIVAACILFYFFVDRFQGFRGALNTLVTLVRPFIFGAVIAYLLYPVRCSLIRLLEKWMHVTAASKRRRTLCAALATVLSLLFLLLLIYGLCALLLPQLYQSVATLAANTPRYIEQADALITQLVERYPLLEDGIGVSADDAMEKIADILTDRVLPKFNSMLGSISSGVISFLYVAKDLVIGIIIAVYIMSGYPTFRRQAKELTLAIFPYKWDRPLTEEQFADWLFRQISILNRLTGGFIKGKLLDSLIIGLMCFAFCILVKMPYALLVSVVVGVTNIIPFFGPFIGAIPSALLILIISPKMCVVFVVFILVLQQLDGNVIGPKILGSTTNLSSFWVLFAVLFFGGLMGVTGMLIGVPLFGFIYQLISETVHKRIAKHREKLKEYMKQGSEGEAAAQPGTPAGDDAKAEPAGPKTAKE